jgi:hypothetical protein
MEKRGSIIGGLILIAAGMLFLLLQINTEIAAGLNLELQWPLIIIGIGLLFIVGALLGTASLAVPGMIVGGVGALFYYQNLTGNWESWAYVWALIPGFVGLGLILMGLLDREQRSSIRGGITLIIISLVLFAIFGGFLGGFGILQQFWPVLLIVAGIMILLRGRSGRRSKKEEMSSE